jgi:hypothetical protein
MVFSIKRDGVEGFAEAISLAGRALDVAQLPETDEEVAE